MEIECIGRLVFPSFCDPDSHLHYPLNHSQNLTGKQPNRIKLDEDFSNSFRFLHEMTEEQIYFQALDHLDEVIKRGTGAIEIKSGYGLEAGEGLELLQVIRKLKATTPLIIHSTFLGTHTFPDSFLRSPGKYNDHILDILPVVLREELADNLDLYYDQNLLTRKEMEMILQAGLKEGLNEMIILGGEIQ